MITDGPLAALTDALARHLAERHPEAGLDAARFVRRNDGGKNGDLQVNVAFALAKTLKRKPADVAATLAEELDAGPAFAALEPSGPGFVNVTLADDWLAARVGAVAAGAPALSPRADAEPVLIDFSSPNVAKEMHVGHLRSTVIGDCLANVYEARGSTVERISHVGDWGTQFGMLIEFLFETGEGADADPSDLNGFYRDAKARFDADEDFKDRARKRVVALQSGDERTRAAWATLCEASRTSFQALYDVMRVDVREVGESAYQDELADVVADLDAAGLLQLDDGARCVFPPGFENRDGEPLPVIIQKADGGYNYDTTDLAAVRRRVRSGLKRLLYVVDHGQSQHFAMVFAVARMAGWIPDDVVVEHIPFGLVLGEDGKRLRTRSGESVPLELLLREAVDAAGRLLVEHDGDASNAQSVGISAVRYAELAHNRMTNYEFSLDKMVTMQGNTAPYLLYAYARMQGVLRAVAATEAEHVDGPVLAGASRGLASRLADLPDVVAGVATGYTPNDLCEYLFELSQAFNRFYEERRVIGLDGRVDTGALLLVQATAATIAAGLVLLGVEPLERL